MSYFFLCKITKIALIYENLQKQSPRIAFFVSRYL